MFFLGVEGAIDFRGTGVFYRGIPKRGSYLRADAVIRNTSAGINAADFAAESANSFPGMSQWPGIH